MLTSNVEQIEVHPVSRDGCNLIESLLSCWFQALEMIQNIRTSFNDLLNEVPWMDSETREVARQKAITLSIIIMLT